VATQRRRALEVAAAELEDARTGKRRVSGRKRGIQVHFSVTSAGWEVAARVARGPYVVDLAPRNAGVFDADLAQVVRFSDPAFDRAVQVGGAPAELLCDLFDERLRRRLRFLRPRELRAADGRVRLSQSYIYFYAEPEDIAAAIDVVATVAERLGEFLRCLEKASLAEARCVSSPYRGMPDRRRIERALARRRTAVSRYLDGQRRLRRRERNRAKAAVGVLVGWCALILVVNLLL
jgi:hypothetical protein